MTSSKDELITAQADTLSADEIADAYTRWQAPKMVSVTDVNQGLGLLTVEDIEKLQKEAEQEGRKAGFEKGRNKGYQAGLAEGKQEIARQVQLLQEIANNLNKPLEELDTQLETDIIALVMTMTRQLVHREFTTQPENVVGAVRAAMKTLPINDRKLKLFVHPQDIELIKSGLSLEHDDTHWQWIEDPMLTPGGVRVETADTRVDATIEDRLKNVINKLLGDDRIEAELDD
ncbi:MAG: flagellar assembly protein FliH [Gammaproteobacteria bacterium]|nr:MAG: flagellar assembly protein FliH [Gammaproteobacteria bacterium]